MYVCVCVCKEEPGTETVMEYITIVFHCHAMAMLEIPL